MFAKTLAIAVVLAGAAGAGAGYLQRHPVSWDGVWHQMTAFRGPLTGETKTPEHYVAGKQYRFCRSEFRTRMKSLALGDKQEACNCFDRTFQSWSPGMQQAAKLVILGKATMAANPAERAFSRIGAMPQGGATHQRQVWASQTRDQVWHVQKNYRDALSGKGGGDVVANPLLLIAANYRVERVIAKCGIDGARSGRWDPSSVFGGIGALRR